VLSSGNSKFREESLARKSEIEYQNKDYAAALQTFKELQVAAESRENIQAAKLGIMRSAQFIGNTKETLEAANELLKDSKLSPEIQSEAKYLRAQAYIKSGEPDKAIEDFTSLSKDTRTEYGAEAKYMLAQLYYDKKNPARAEKILTEFIASGTPHQYWLARGFILLSDIYLDKDDKFQARQYLTSLQRNYKDSEEINRMIENRLKKIK
jgi:TolA-binding protein